MPSANCFSPPKPSFSSVRTGTNPSVTAVTRRCPYPRLRPTVRPPDFRFFFGSEVREPPFESRLEEPLGVRESDDGITEEKSEISNCSRC
ncbi:hypothetical protein GWI33_013780 [Rhynchophorus ferrugineus]|uniref:Uncharacterized protein n=1 Tax=Rhynchophorus ferrugineus TaxID=354439 RepID=A0A834I2S6_RHYFE|nr:hypothetical protein GWI33_013780 [Rhynchophorus ferrugineus]